MALNSALKEINPSRVDLGTIERPPAYSVRPVSYEKLLELSGLIKNQNLNIVARRKEEKRSYYTEEEILETVRKRPLGKEEVETLFDGGSLKNLEKLLGENKICESDGFYRISERD